MSDDFYKAFEERYRGQREAIASRLRIYLPFVEPLARLDRGASTLDLGCGRGEWLELMGEIGFSAHGIDLDEGMLADCLERGLSVQQGDAVAYLAALPGESQAVISAFHVVEHIAFEQLRTMVAEAIRVLRPGGLLIMETPNPENIIVATRNFYLDPTHRHPIPPALLSFLPEYYGFARTKVLRLQESRTLAAKASPTLGEVLGGASPDYGVVAQRGAPPETLALFDQAFSQDHGLLLDTLAARYDNAIAVRIHQVEAAAQEAHGKALGAERRAEQAEAAAQEAHAKALGAETRAEQAEAALVAIHQSRSWRITAPLRRAGHTARRLAHGSGAWLRLAPGSRPHRAIQKLRAGLASGIYGRPGLKAGLSRLLSPFPKVAGRLRAMAAPVSVDSSDFLDDSEDGLEGFERLSPGARRTYFDLKAAIERRRKERS